MRCIFHATSIESPYMLCVSTTANNFYVFCSADNQNKFSKRPGGLTCSSFTGAHVNEIHKMEKPIAALIIFFQDKILYSHKIQLIYVGPSKGGG